MCLTVNQQRKLFHLFVNTIFWPLNK